MSADPSPHPVVVLEAGPAEALRAASAQAVVVEPGVWLLSDPVLGTVLLVESRSFPPREVTTARLFLRPLREEDGRALFDGHARHLGSVEYLTVSCQEHPSESRAYARRQEHAWSAGERGVAWAIAARHTGALVGCFDQVREGGRALVGFAVFRTHWGRGYATEALRGMLAAARADPTLDRVEAVTHPDNHASQRVLEKAGFERVGREAGVVRYPNRSGDPGDLVRWAWTPPSGVDGPP